MNIPDTRASLIFRLSDPTDVEAWEEFTAIYQPLVYRLARRNGLQDADAQELVQEVMLAISRAVDGWEPDAERGRFRDWLFRIARNFMINFLTRRKHRPWSTGDSGVEALINQQCQTGGDESTLFDLEFRRELFHWASAHVQTEVAEKTWNAFWLSSVEERPIPDVAEQLGMTIGSVYIARSRVLFRLRERVRQFKDVGDDAQRNLP